VTFYFYDLETSGVNPRSSRIMQFGGQRTDLNLKPIGKPDNFLIKLTEDILPDPEAVLIHGITPQKAKADGITESEAAKYLTSQVFLPDTIVVGFNNIRFDDEFIRHLFWRNFTDSYEWHYKDGRSRWDLLDVARMTRALRPEGINWPFASDGTPSNKLELLALVNKLDHDIAHDALSDVMALLAVARLLQNKQTKLFNYLLKMRSKNLVGALVTKGEPFIYTSGRYPSDFDKTTVAVMIAPHPDRDAALVYDLRVNPTQYTDLTPVRLAKLWSLRGKDAPYFPIKKLSFNRCPAIAPLNVLDSSSAVRLKIDSAAVDKNFTKLKMVQDFGDKAVAALEIIEPPRQPELLANEQTVDGQLYEGFINSADKTKASVVRAADGHSLADLQLDFADERLKALFLLYKARNYFSSLNPDETQRWDNYRHVRLTDGGDSSRLNLYFARLNELGAQPRLTKDQKYLLSELKSYGQSIVPDG